ncbi:MAG: FAD-dependent oxidoreductase, partial [Clostridia bacterium]|nr:FAD-dependent oxidoreductase [Clostridia bacterium]
KVSNYPGIKLASGFDISQALYEQVKQYNIDMKNELVISLKQRESGYEVATNKNKYYADHIIIATGAKTNTLGINDEKKFVGRGVSYCATCDGNFFKDMPVAVYGVGKTALEDIKYLHNVTSQVYWLIPNKSLPEQLLGEVKDLTNLKIKYSCEVLNLVGDTHLQEVVVYNTCDKKTETIKVSGLFVSLGRQPDLSWLEVQIKTNKNGYVLVDKNCQTSHKGIFACGDITSRTLKQILTACSDGAIASSFIITNR